MKRNPRTATLLLSVAACAVVLGTFAGLVPFPEISRATVNLLSDAIAVVNTLALALLVAGWYFIRHGQVDRHRLATVGATVLIVAFLATYLPKVGGEKAIGTPHNALYFAYLGMLAVHVLLSVFACRWWSTRSCSVSTHTPAELRTVHPRVGKVAAATWITGLALGVVTYVTLDHVYGYEFVRLRRDGDGAVASDRGCRPLPTADPGRTLETSWT